MILDQKDRDRIAIVSADSNPVYLLTNYRQVKDRDDSQYLDDHFLFYQATVDGETILSVFKNKHIVTTSKVTKIDRVYTAEEIHKLSYRFVEKRMENGKTVVLVKILNSGDIPIAAVSSVNKPIRISWRFLDSSGKLLSGWDTRKDLPFDIPAQ